MATLRFTKDQLIEALESRRSWAEKTDADQLAAHQKAEREHLAKFRAVCREAVKWDYATAKQRSFRAQPQREDGGTMWPPDCPRSLVVLLDRHVRMVEATRQDRFIVSADGTWSQVFYLLTHNDTDKAEMC